MIIVVLINSKKTCFNALKTQRGSEAMSKKEWQELLSHLKLISPSIASALLYATFNIHGPHFHHQHHHLIIIIIISPSSLSTSILSPSAPSSLYTTFNIHGPLVGEGHNFLTEYKC